MQIKDLKVHRLGWTKIFLWNGNQNEHKCILVKKNLFKDYTIIDEFGRKLTISDLSEISGKYISHSYSMFANTDEQKNVNDIFFNNREKENKYKQEIQKQTDINEQNIEKYEEKIEDLSNDYKHQLQQKDYEKESLQRQRVAMLENSFKGVYKIKSYREGYDIEYEKPNYLQSQIGYTSVPVRKRWKHEFESNENMASYLNMMERKLDEQFKPYTKNLTKYLGEIQTYLGELKKNFSEQKYIQTTCLINEFINRFVTFLIECSKDEKNYQLSHYERYSHYERSDEETTGYDNSDYLLQSGIDKCAEMIESFKGPQYKEKFLNIITPNPELTQKSGFSL